MKGSYVLLIKLKKDKDIKIGKLGNISFKKGYYVYVGSALNGLEQRINRHLRQEKKLHWHIDYLLQNAEIIETFYRESNKNEECILAKSFKHFQSIKGFGCSDCKCNSHLFYGKIQKISKVVKSLSLSEF